MNKDLQLKVTLTGDGRQLTGTLKSAQADVQQFGSSSASASATAVQGFQSVDQQAQQLGTRLTGLTDAILRLGAGWIGYQGVVRGIRAADDYGQMAARIRMATESAEDYQLVQQRLLETAGGTYRPLAEAQELYIRTADALHTVGYATEHQLDITDSLSYAYVVNAASADKAASSINAFSRSIQTGRVTAEDWQSMLAATPTLVNDIASATGKSAEEVRRLGVTGKLALTDLTEGLRLARDENQALSDGMATTVDDALTRLRVNLVSYIGQANESTGATQKLAAGIVTVAENIDTLATVALVAGAAAAGRYAVSIAASTAASVKDTLAKRAAAAQELQLAQAQAQAATAATALRSAQVQAAMGAGHLTVAKATDAHTAAVQRLTAAQQGHVTIGRGLLGILGGPAGLAVTVGLAATAFLTMGNSAAAGTTGVDLMTQSLEDMGEATRQLHKAELARQLTEKERDARRSRQAADLIDAYTPDGARQAVEVLEHLARAEALDKEIAAIRERTKAIEDYERSRKSNTNQPNLSITNPEQEKALQRLLDQLEQQHLQLTTNERQLLQYQLGMAGATTEQAQYALVIHDSNVALKAEQKAQETAAAAAKKAAEEQDKYLESILDSIDPTRALAREMERVWAAFGAGDLDADQVVKYIDHLTKGFKKATDQGEKAFERMADRVAQTLQQTIASGDWQNVGTTIGGILAGEIGGMVGQSLASNLSSSLGSTAGTLLGGIGGALAGGVIGGMFAGRRRTITEEIQFELQGLIASGFEQVTIKSSGVFGSSTRRYQQSISDTTTGIIERSFAASVADIEQQARHLGADATGALDDFAFKLRDSSLTLDQFTVAAAESYVQSVFAAISDYQYAHESVMDAWNRMAADARNIGSAFERSNAGQSFQTAYSSILEQSRAAIVAEQTAVRDAVLSEMSELDRLRSGARYTHGGRNQSDRWTDEYAALMQIYADELGMSGVRVGQGNSGLSGASQRRAAGQVDQRLADELADANARIQQAYETATASFVDGITSALAAIEGVDVESASALFAEISDSWLAATQGQSALLLAYQQQTESAVNSLFGQMGLTAEYGAGDALASYNALFDDYRATALATAQAAGTDLASALGRAEGEIARMQQALLAADQAAQDYAATLEGGLLSAMIEGGDEIARYFADLASWADAEQRAIETDYRARIQMLERQATLSTQIGDYVAKLRLSDLSPAAPAEKLAQAGDEFAALLVRAQEGDLDAASKLQSAADAYLKNADQYYGRTDIYTGIFDDVATQLEQLGLNLGATSTEDHIASLQEQMLVEQQQVRDFLEQELSWAVSQYDKLTDIEQLLSALPGSLGSTLQGLMAAPSAPITGTPTRPINGSHFGGLRRVPFDGYRAELHRDEGVLTASENRALARFDLSPLQTELAALRQEVAQLRAERSADASAAARQRDVQTRGIDSVARNSRREVKTL